MPRALRDALARHVRGTTAKTVPGDQPGRTQDTGDRADRTAVRGRAKAQGIEVKHRRRVPAEPLVEFKAATGQQNPGHPSLPGYAVSRSCRNECVRSQSGIALSLVLASFSSSKRHTSWKE
jgi:hypothetical protein